MDMAIDNSIKENARRYMNEKLGKDFKNLRRIQDIKEEIVSEKESAEQELKLEINSITSNLTANVEEIDSISNEFEIFSKRAIQYLGTTNNVVRTLEDYVEKIETLEVTIQYIKIATKIEHISSELHSSIINKDDELSVTLYANLCEIILSLQNSPTHHLLTYLKDVIHHWHNYLKDKFSVIFDDLLNQIKWPFVNTNLTSPSPTPETIQKLQIYVEYLLQIQLPEESVKPVVTSALLTEFPPVCLPILFLIKPLKKRFLFHFYGNKQTNRSDKPEWFMTQILTWIRDHEKFVQNTIQPVINRLAMHQINARIEFMRGLIQLCVEKLDAELPSLAYDDALFSHCVDEALGMERELRLVYAYPMGQPGCLGPLTHASILQKWLNMEKKYALEKMDNMFISSTAWNNLISESDDDDLKITECANAFITLLTTMTERYQPLPQPGHRLQFLDLQLDLLDDFRIRLLQLSHYEMTDDNVTERMAFILNTIRYITETLTEWGETIHFINLHYFKHQFMEHGVISLNNDADGDLLSTTEGGTVFDETISLYSHMKDDLILTLTEAVVLDVKARSRAYRHDSWYLMPVVKDSISLSLTSTACPMFQILATRMHELQELLAVAIFNDVWRKIAKQLNAFFYEELILQNNFNEGGAMQINYDITRNLIPLFGQYTSKPDIYFHSIKESCLLLTLPKSSAILLLDTLKVEPEENKINALRELGVRKLTPIASEIVLKLRIDLRTL